MGENRKLKAYRLMLGLSAQEMANDLGINISTYCKKENGKSKFNIVEMKKVSLKIGKSVEDIFFSNEIIL